MSRELHLPFLHAHVCDIYVYVHCHGYGYMYMNVHMCVCVYRLGIAVRCLSLPFSISYLEARPHSNPEVSGWAGLASLLASGLSCPWLLSTGIAGVSSPALTEAQALQTQVLTLACTLLVHHLPSSFLFISFNMFAPGGTFACISNGAFSCWVGTLYAVGKHSAVELNPHPFFLLC